MVNDTGVYILVSPSEKKEKKEEYRVAYIDSSGGKGTITFDLTQASTHDAVNPVWVKPHFNKSEVFTDELDAEEEASRIAEENYAGNAPVFHIYISTPYPKWSITTYAKSNA